MQDHFIIINKKKKYVVFELSETELNITRLKKTQD